MVVRRLARGGRVVGGVGLPPLLGTTWAGIQSGVVRKPRRMGAALHSHCGVLLG